VLPTSLGGGVREEGKIILEKGTPFHLKEHVFIRVSYNEINAVVVDFYLFPASNHIFEFWELAGFNQLMDDGRVVARMGKDPAVVLAVNCNKMEISLRPFLRQKEDRGTGAEEFSQAPGIMNVHLSFLPIHVDNCHEAVRTEYELTNNQIGKRENVHGNNMNGLCL